MALFSLETSLGLFCYFQCILTDPGRLVPPILFPYLYYLYFLSV